MPDDTTVLAAVLVAAGITFALRAVPFALVEPLRGARVMAHLGAWMPAGVMLILVVYLLRDVPDSAAPQAAATLGALAVVVGLYLRTRNALLSIGIGTVAHVLAVNLL